MEQTQTLEGYGWATIDGGARVKIPREVTVVSREDCKCGESVVEMQGFADGAIKWWVRCDECELIWYAVFITDEAGNPVRER